MAGVSAAWSGPDPSGTHALHCALWSSPDPGGACTCRVRHLLPEPAGPVSAAPAAPDGVCAHRPQWQVGPHGRACDQCLADTLRRVRATSDGFAPVLVLPVGAKR